MKSAANPSTHQRRPRRVVRSVVALLALAIILVEAVIGFRWWLIQRHLASARRAMDIVAFDDALTRLAAADRLAPGRADVHYLFAVAYRRTDRLDRYRAHLDQARQLGWNSTDLARQELLLTVQLGRMDDVKSELDDLLAKDHDDRISEEIFEALAKGYMASYRLRDANNCLSFWIDGNPDSIRAHMWRGDIHRRMRDNAAALDDFRAVLEVDPDFADAHREIGDIHMDLNAADEARLHYELVLKTVPDDFQALVGVARCDLTSADEAHAEEILSGLIKRELNDDQRATVLVELGRIALFQGDFGESINLLTEALQLAPENGNIHHSLGTALAQSGSEDRAKYHFDKGREVGERNRRLYDLTMQLVTNPGDADRRVEIAEILFKQGFIAESAAWLRTAIQHDPDHTEAHRLLATIYQKQLRNDLAQHHRDQARRAEASQNQAAPSSGENSATSSSSSGQRG